MPRPRGVPRRLVAVVAVVAAVVVAAGAWALIGPGARGPGGDAPSIAFFGDSLTEGIGAPSGRGYAWQTAELLDWPVAVVDGVSGSGFLAPGRGRPMPERVAAVVASDPDVVVVAGGTNDAFQGYDAAAIQAAATDVLTGLRAGLPDATIVVLGPFTSALVSGVPDGAAVDAVRAAATAADLDFIPASDIVGDALDDPLAASRLLSADGLHPNEDGYAVMADELAERLPALVP
jgi:lysophospholipase L1-like esterase